MSSWESYKLADLCQIYDGPHATPPKAMSGNVFLGISSINYDGRIDDSQFEYVDDEYFTRWTRRILPTAKDIVFSYETKLGTAAIIPQGFKCCLGRRMGLLRCNEKVLPEFLLYYYLSPEFQGVIKERTYSGSTVDRIPLKEMGEFPLRLPSLTEQKAIASVLLSLNDKIDLLHRQNNTLEAMAETLLIQHILPKEDTQDEELHQLGDYLDTVSVTHKLSKSQVIFLNTSDIYKGKVLTTELSDVKTLPGQAKKSILKGDILFSEIRPANGRYALVDFEADNYVVSTKLMVLRAKQSKLLGLLYFYITNRHTTDWLQVLAESRSGTFPQITFDQVADLEFRLPKGQMLENLILLLDDILLKQSANNKQIQTLEQLRDTLLPKLMSGEVRVQYQTEQVA
ncbi:TPA: restriction endonuclease subunit S [Acinetobacter baumannii]